MVSSLGTSGLFLLFLLSPSLSQIQLETRLRREEGTKAVDFLSPEAKGRIDEDGFGMITEETTSGRELVGRSSISSDMTLAVGDSDRAAQSDIHVSRTLRERPVEESASSQGKVGAIS